jgi:autotransporter-associated beta strand protein
MSALPVLTHLHNDIVSWVNPTTAVTLDLGADALPVDADLDGVNDWSGASLSVQRLGAANAADVLGFNTSSALFTVSGVNLLSGGSIFATFTNTGGVLAISFTSSGTPATSALVQDVVRRITYLNATPSGDTTVRFTLNDVDGSPTADVTVASDTIYVTNATDTATVDVSNGVSFSEAVAIAAADTTGTQTIAHISGLSYITPAGNLTIAENLTLDQAGASGLMSGRTLTLNSGVTLTATGSGTYYLLPALAGDGNLTLNKGSGYVLVSGNNSGLTSASTVTLITGDLNMESATALGSATIITKAGLADGGIRGNSNAPTIPNAIKFFGPDSYLNLTDRALTFTGAVDINAGNGHIYNNSGNAMTFSGAVSNGNLYVERGTVVLSGTTNTYGKTYLGGSSDVTLKIADDSNLGTGAIYLNRSNVSLSTHNVLEITGSGVTIDNAIAMNAFGAGGTIQNANNVTLSGQISGINGWASSFYKTGVGTLTLSGISNYATGALNVEAGTVNITGALNNAATATIASGAAFGGSGAFGGATTVQSGGKLGIDGTKNIFTIDDNLVLSTGATYSVEIEGTTPGTQYDKTVVNGTVNLAGAILSLSGNYVPAVGNSFTLIDNDGSTDAITGQVTVGGSAIAEGGTFSFGGETFTLSYVGGDGNDLVMRIPPPNTAPTISNLDAVSDSVAWVNPTTALTLDQGTALTISDTENDAANWNNASLSVQRKTSINIADVFGVANGTGYTVSGGNLLATANGNAIFGTVDTSVAGKVTVTFTGSGTNATNALVQDVMQHVTYLNATPSGDTLVTFTLNDGSDGSTTADVTVASDTIYITNATDTATIDVSNGVSFSEAVAIAAADATGTQTLVLASSIGNVSSNLVANLEAGEPSIICGAFVFVREVHVYLSLIL